MWIANFMIFHENRNVTMKKSRNPLQVELTNEQAEMKQYLKDKGYNLSFYVRKLIVNLYEQEKKKDNSSLIPNPTYIIS